VTQEALEDGGLGEQGKEAKFAGAPRARLEVDVEGPAVRQEKPGEGE
jgi:hypothetical protein